MNTEKDLEIYWSKRDFTKTNEPQGRKFSGNKSPIFVIQKHAASQLHYDFRLEINGVLKSWAIPKGPSTDPSIKRLAVPTENHPLEYADFEGIIPAGEYGGGTMIVWDSGTYHVILDGANNPEWTISDSQENGLLDIWLEGKKLKGGYTLVRTGKGEKPRWLLFKKSDNFAIPDEDITELKPASVLSGKTIEEMKGKSGEANG